MKLFVLAGEASGDKQAALLCEAIFTKVPDAIIKGWGGEAMMSHGVGVTRHYRELAYMGFVEVIRHLPAILRNFSVCKKEIMELKPDALILVDYPGFNLRMALWAFSKKIPVFYYISPQLWAWHTSRVKTIKRAVRRMYVILPFEKEFYAQYGVDAMYIGHPLAMELSEKILPSSLEIKNRIALLPGSRKHEVELILPVMISLAKLLPAFQFTIVGVDHIPAEFYKHIIDGQSNVRMVFGNMHQVLRESEAAIVTSGTATLETALTGTPQIVVYKGNPLSYQLAKRLVKIPFISLVNLIAGKQLVPELIQTECTAANMKEKLIAILHSEEYSAIKQGYHSVRDQLTSGGGPSAAAADIISDLQSIKM